MDHLDYKSENLFIPMVGYRMPENPNQTNSKGIYTAYWANPFREEKACAFFCYSPNQNESPKVGYSSDHPWLFQVRKVVPSPYMPERKEIAYLDMCLPSGTLWASKTEHKNATWYEAIRFEAISRTGCQVPSINQYKELFTYCTVKFIKQIYSITYPIVHVSLLITAKNGNQIYINSEYLWTHDEQDSPEIGSYCVHISEDKITYFLYGRKDQLGVHMIK